MDATGSTVLLWPAGCGWRAMRRRECEGRHGQTERTLLVTHFIVHVQTRAALQSIGQTPFDLHGGAVPPRIPTTGVQHQIDTDNRVSDHRQAGSNDPTRVRFDRRSQSLPSVRSRLLGDHADKKSAVLGHCTVRAASEVRRIEEPRRRGG